jgi:4'-phosphopantetheinyl transferase
VHLWITCLQRVDEKVCARYEELLSSDELQCLCRFRFDRDKKRFLVTRALARSVLSKYADVRPENWLFKKNSFGRPHIGNDGFKSNDLPFNISHSNELIVMVVGRARSIGVDVEQLNAGIAAHELREHLSDQEIRELHEVEKGDRSQRLIELWTLKEAYVKALGRGLSTPLNVVSFKLNTAASLLFSNGDRRAGKNHWVFWQFRLCDSHIVAVCCNGIAPFKPKLIVRNYLPLGGAELAMPIGVRTNEGDIPF